MRRFFGKIADYIRECDKMLFALCIIASLFGCVAVLSATYHVNHSLRQFIVQILGFLLGLILAVIISRIDYKSIEKFRFVFLGISIALVVLTFFIGYAPPGTDDKAWLKLFGGLTLQPAELLKIAFIISFAWHLAYVNAKINKIGHLLLLLLHGGVMFLLIHRQGDDGTALVFLFIIAAMLFAAGLWKRYIFIAAGAAAVASPFVYFFVLNEDQQRRLLQVFNMESDLLGSGWQQWKSRIALANGRLFGTGFLKGDMVQSGGIPEGENDFIFAGIGEEFGMFGCLIVIVLLVLICWRIFKIGSLCDDKSQRLMCVGVGSMILSQSVINIGMNISILPVIGITLPFFSAGGTSLVCLYLGIGIVMSAYMGKNRGAIHLRGR